MRRDAPEDRPRDGHVGLMGDRSGGAMVGPRRKIMNLRMFHLLFILAAIVMADMFGAWAVWRHAQTGDGATLAAAVLSFLAGFALIGYTIWLVRKLDRAHVD
jgi:hypothetical protein